MLWRRATKINRLLPKEVLIVALPECRAVLRVIACFFCFDVIVGVSIKPATADR